MSDHQVETHMGLVEHFLVFANRISICIESVGFKMNFQVRVIFITLNRAFVL
jgi:hypothetical protein